MNIFLKRYNGQNGHFMRFWHQNVASRIYALLSVIRQQMSTFDPFRGGSPKVDNVTFFYRFFIGELPLVGVLSLSSYKSIADCMRYNCGSRHGLCHLNREQWCTQAGWYCSEIVWKAIHLSKIPIESLPIKGLDPIIDTLLIHSP